MFSRFLSHKKFFVREHKRSLAVGIMLLTLSCSLQFYASIYSSRIASNSVGDIFLDNLPVVNLNPIIVEGALLALLLTSLLFLLQPSYLLFGLKAVAIFVATRAFFVSATHLGIYPGQINPDTVGIDKIYTGLNLQAGFFFSAHTGLPFLMALIFWKKPSLRFAYLLLSIVFGISVLLAHVHYSIDVFAAPFMTYSIFKLTQYLFPSDYELVESA